VTAIFYLWLAAFSAGAIVLVGVMLRPPADRADGSRRLNWFAG